MTMNKEDLLYYIAENIFHNVGFDNYLSLIDWIMKKELDTTFQILTVYSNSGVLGYVVRDGVEYFVIYHKGEDNNAMG